MVKVIEMDEKATINVQLEEDTGAVILINMFTVTHEDADQFLKTWASAAEISETTWIRTYNFIGELRVAV